MDCYGHADAHHPEKLLGDRMAVLSSKARIKLVRSKSTDDAQPGSVSGEKLPAIGDALWKQMTARFLHR